MIHWTNKQWGALIGALVMFSVALVGFQGTALVALFGVLGYFVGKFLDGDLDLEDIRERSQRRRRPRYLQDPASSSMFGGVLLRRAPNVYDTGS